MNKKTKRNEHNSEDGNDDEEEEEQMNIKINSRNPSRPYKNLPQKSKYRMHAHCNPLSIVSVPYPFDPSQVDWSIHYPTMYNPDEIKENQLNEKVAVNTEQFPIVYDNSNYKPTATSIIPNDYHIKPQVTIVDIGCGYGGLLYNMSTHLDKGELGLGMEIRDRVSNYVGERIQTLRYNANHEQYINISIIRTNTMKLLLNYFYKGQLNKLFFCFADPHFKKYNHRKRIINRYLLNDYSYLLKKGGKLYSITDVEELHKWHMEILSQNPSFKRLPQEDLLNDPFLADMKNTDEARRVIKRNGAMYFCVYERVTPIINSIKELYDTIQFSQLE